MQPSLISSQYFLLLLSNSNIALLLTHSWEMQHNGWIVMQLGRLEFQHIPYCAPCPCRSRWILEHCGIATYYVALWNCNILCCIVEHSARRILQHCQQVKWDSSTLQQIALHWGWTLISPTQHLLWWQQAQWCWTRRLTRRSTWCWTSSSSSTFPPWCFRMGSVCWSTSGLILSNRRSCPSSSNW